MFDSTRALNIEQRAALEVLERLTMACLREGLLDGEIGDESVRLVAGENQISLSLSQVFSMDRFDLAELPNPISFEHFLERFFPDLESSRRSELLAELENSFRTMALSLKAQQELGLGEPGSGSLADWEGRVWCGHPLHPGARLRSGLNDEENREYGPEWQVEIELPLLSVPAEMVVETGEFAQRFQSMYPSLTQEEGRVLLPVHPWQAKRDLPNRFADHFSSSDFRWSGESIKARPTMSFRSVVLDPEVGEDFHLKLPVAVQTTGATRTVSVASTHNGPAMSRFLNQLFSHQDLADSGLFHYLHLMAEPASFHLCDDGTDRSRFLSAILRRGPGEQRIGGRRWLLPAAALLEPRENPLFIRAARYYGVGVVELFSAYCRRLLPAQAFLCGQLGVALESHPQNIVVDLRGPAGSPPDIHFWYRDLGGIRFHPKRLAHTLKKRGWEGLSSPTFWPGSATCTESDRDLSSKFVYSILQNHLGELIRAISRHGVDESTLWRVVDEILDEHRHLLGADLEERVFAPHWDLKAMWTMRHEKAITEYTFRPVENPLLGSRDR